MIARLLLIGAGGFLGAVGRYLLGGAVQRLGGATTAFPWGTLAVNVLGCLIIGALYGIAEAREVGSGVRLFLATGVLGGFTTFSTFGLETVALAREGAPLRAGVNAVATLALCLAAVWLGHAMASGR